ncbi:MAG: alpha/beta hydrolase [Oscillospiraceae bacterium]|nr:alpha/beta hydrolase [Oscillospiraceae bacterium]
MSNINKNIVLYPETENGIYLYEYPMINAIKQYVQVRGSDRNNPLILFVHGGPGSSLAGLCHVLQAGWEDKFTVANWDQRNTCKTYFANKESAEEIVQTGTMEDFIKDIDEVIAFLHTVYDFEKLILMGFSWGTAIGSEYAKRHPENLLCYISVGQLTNYREGVLFTCRKMLGLVQKGGKDEMKIKQIIETFPRNPVWNKEMLSCLKYYNALCMKYIAKHARRITLSNIFGSPFLNFKEKRNFLMPDYPLFTKAFETMLSYDFRRNMKYEVPVLFIFGDEETVCNPELVEECSDNISAPVREIKIIPKASHMCFFDQPDAFSQTLVSFLNDINS